MDCRVVASVATISTTVTLSYKPCDEHTLPFFAFFAAVVVGLELRLQKT